MRKMTSRNGKKDREDERSLKIIRGRGGMIPNMAFKMPLNIDVCGGLLWGTKQDMSICCEAFEQSPASSTKFRSNFARTSQPNDPSMASRLFLLGSQPQVTVKVFVVSLCAPRGPRNTRGLA